MPHVDEVVKPQTLLEIKSTEVRDVLVVGAGLGGLATALTLALDGHNVRVLEAAKTFGEVGAGILLPPNSTRLLTRWGIDPRGLRHCVTGHYDFLRWQDGSLLQRIKLDDAKEKFGAPYYTVHRADLHQALLQKALEAGAQIIGNRRVVKYDFEVPGVTAEDGEVFKADLVIGCDGVKSLARSQLLNPAPEPHDTGDIAYRIVLDGKKMIRDPLLSSLITNPGSTAWCGPDAHIVGYPIRQGELYNIVICAKRLQGECETEWIVPGLRSDLTSRFGDWEPRLQRMFDLSQDFCKWKLHDLMPLPYWVHPAGHFSLLGDSCHATLPYLGQGAVGAFEDAACLRRLLRSMMSIPAALAEFQEIRKPRSTTIQVKSRMHQDLLHVEDGAFQKDRDTKMGKETPENPLFWGDVARRDWLFKYDAETADEIRLPDYVAI